MGISPNEEQEELRRHGASIRAAVTAAEEAVERERSRRTEHMKEMHEAGISWAEIGRTFAVTPQAAMYATNYATRTPKKGAASD